MITLGDIPLWAMVPILIVLKIIDVIIMVEIYHKYEPLRTKLFGKRRR